MSSLYEKLKSNQSNTIRTGNGLVRANGAELQQTAKQLGRLVPTSPGLATQMGVSDDSAKMAGTPAQKKGAFNANTNAGESLLDRQRRQQARSQATTQEQETIQKSEALIDAGSIGDSVHNLIKSYVPEQSQQLEQAPLVTATIPTEVAASLSQDTIEAINALGANPTPEMVAQISQQMIQEGVDPTQANPLNYISTSNVGEFTAQNTINADQITVGAAFTDGSFEQSGLDINSLSELLNTTPDQLNNMTLPELERQVQQVEQQEFSRIEDLKSIANDVSQSASARKQARQLLRDASATGIAASDDEIDQLMTKIEQADEIQVGDQILTVEELLSDDTLSQVVNQYINGSDEEKEQISQQLGTQFTDFVTSNQNVLASASDELADATQAVQDIQTQNQELGNIEGVGSISEEIMQELLPDLEGGLAGSVFETPQLIENINSEMLTAGQKANILNVINNKQYPLELLKDKTLAELQDLGVFDNTEDFQNRVENYELSQSLGNIDVSTEAGMNAFESILNENLDLDQIQEELATARYLGESSAFFDAIDKDGDGQIDDMSSLSSNLGEYLGQDDTNTLSSDPIEYADETSQMVAQYASEFLSDGVIEDSEMEQLLDPTFTSNGLTPTSEQSKAQSDLVSFILNKDPQQAAAFIEKYPEQVEQAVIGNYASEFATTYGELMSEGASTEGITYEELSDNFQSTLDKATQLAKISPEKYGSVVESLQKDLYNIQTAYIQRSMDEMAPDIDAYSKAFLSTKPSGNKSRAADYAANILNDKWDSYIIVPRARYSNVVNTPGGSLLIYQNLRDAGQVRINPAMDKHLEKLQMILENKPKVIGGYKT